MYPIVNAVTKAWIQGRDLSVLLVMKYATFFDDTNETEYLAVPFEIKFHYEIVDMTPRNLGDEESLYFYEEYFVLVG